jgi:hypothetical protein
MRERGIGPVRAAGPAGLLGTAHGLMGAGGRKARRAAMWRRADEPFAVSDPACPPAAASEWRRVGATIDPNDSIPGPFRRPLQRIGNAQNAFARLEGPPLDGVEPGARAIFTAVVAAPTALSSALVLTTASGQAELHVDWTEVPPSFALFDRRTGLRVEAGTVDGLGLDVWRLALQARNDARDAVVVKPSLYVTCGIGNAGMAAGLYAGLLRTGCTGAAKRGD